MTIGRKRLTHARAMIEAELDFADEEDVPGSVSDRIWKDMELLRREIDAHIAQAPIGEIIRDGLKIVIAGEPNAGKSSLLNALAKRDIAIVTEIAGTTRDVLSVDLSLAGFSVKLFDTAGLRETDETVEREGIRRARDVIARRRPCAAVCPKTRKVLTPLTDLALTAVPVLRVATKIDRAGSDTMSRAAEVVDFDHNGCGDGPALERHIAAIYRICLGLPPSRSPRRRRHVDALRQAQHCACGKFAPEPRRPGYTR